MRKLGLLLAASNLVVGVLSAGTAPDGVFQDFESDADLQGATVTLPQVDRIERTADPTHGSSGLKFTVGPASTPGATASSGINLYAGTPSLPVSDWSGHAVLGFDFFTEQDYTTVGRITVRDQSNKAWGVDYPIRARDWTPIDLQLKTIAAAGVDISRIAYIGFSIPRSTTPVIGHYDAFRLVDSYPYDETPYADQAARQLLRLADFSGVLAKLDTQLKGLRTDNAELRAQVDAAAKQCADLRQQLGPMTYAQYRPFNAAVAALQRTVPRLANTIQAWTHDRQADFGLESADSMTLVYPKDLPFTSTGTAPTVSLTRGEYESVQAVVLPFAEPLTGVQARVTSAPPGLQATVAPVGSLDVTPTNVYHRPTYAGWTPDPIRDDLTTVDVPADSFQPYWIRLKAAPNAKPGTYHVTVGFTAAGKQTRTMTVAAKVWPVTVPDAPKLNTSFQFTPAIVNDLYGITDPAAQGATKHQYWSFLHDYKIEPDQLYTCTCIPSNANPVIVPTPVEDVLYIRDHYGLRDFNAFYLWAGMLNASKPETWQAQIDTWIAQLRTAMGSYRAAGVDKYAYVYGFDEASGPLLEAAKRTFAAVKQAFPDLPIMTTLRDNSMGVDTGLTGLVDIWAPQQDLYSQAVADRTRARGDQAWWYPDIATGSPLPNWFNGYPPIDTRTLAGPMSFKAGVEGMLYYATNRWLRTDHANQLLVNDGILSAWKAGTFNGTAGDGSMFYPGPNGPMASIRLENFRDGMEDYNLLWLLRERLRTDQHVPPPVRAHATALLAANPVVTDQRTFTEDPVRYRAWRTDVIATLGGLE
ncbi:glycoside hydrolase domain-containing protein [Kribbella sp. WER1]